MGKEKKNKNSKTDPNTDRKLLNRESAKRSRAKKKTETAAALAELQHLKGVLDKIALNNPSDETRLLLLEAKRWGDLSADDHAHLKMLLEEALQQDLLTIEVEDAVVTAISNDGSKEASCSHSYSEFVSRDAIASNIRANMFG